MEHIHTRIDAPITLRKHLLEAALLATESTQLRDKIKNLDENKKLFRTQLKNMLKQIRTDIDNLTKSIPPLPEEFERKSEFPHDPYVAEEGNVEEDLEYIRKRLKSMRSTL